MPSQPRKMFRRKAIRRVTFGSVAGVLHHDESLTAVGAAPAAAGVVIEQDAVLDGNVGHRVDVQVLVAFVIGLIEEHAIAERDVVGEIVDLDQVVVAAIMDQAVLEKDVVRPCRADVNRDTRPAFRPSRTSPGRGTSRSPRRSSRGADCGRRGSEAGRGRGSQRG